MSHKTNSKCKPIVKPQKPKYRRHPPTPICTPMPESVTVAASAPVSNPADSKSGSPNTSPPRPPAPARHGMARRNLVVCAEDARFYRQFTASLTAIFDPQDDNERFIVEQMIIHRWFILHADASEAAAMRVAMCAIVSPRQAAADPGIPSPNPANPPAHDNARARCPAPPRIYPSAASPPFPHPDDLPASNSDSELQDLATAAMCSDNNVQLITRYRVRHERAHDRWERIFHKCRASRHGREQIHNMLNPNDLRPQKANFGAPHECRSSPGFPRDTAFPARVPSPSGTGFPARVPSPTDTAFPPHIPSPQFPPDNYSTDLDQMTADEYFANDPERHPLGCDCGHCFQPQPPDSPCLNPDFNYNELVAAQRPTSHAQAPAPSSPHPTPKTPAESAQSSDSAPQPIANALATHPSLIALFSLLALWSPARPSHPPQALVPAHALASAQTPADSPTPFHYPLRPFAPAVIHRIPMVLEAENLSVRLSATGTHRTIVDSVSLCIARGETLGLVGESGSGKTTLARAIMRLVHATGVVRLCGQDFLAARGAALRQMRRSAQMVFQDPFASLNPRHTIERIVREGLDVFDIGPPSKRNERVSEELELVGLSADFARRYPHELSGGQRQRVSIARAIIIRPALVICDEPVSALDMTVQMRIISLLRDLQSRLGLSYLFIGHHLGVMRQISHKMAVMRRGQIVEQGPTAEVLNAPRHDYTRALLSAVLEPPPFSPTVDSTA